MNSWAVIDAVDDNVELRHHLLLVHLERNNERLERKTNLSGCPGSSGRKWQKDKSIWKRNNFLSVSAKCTLIGI